MKLKIASSTDPQLSMSDSPKPTSNLLALPPEIRQCIWEKLVEEYGTLTLSRSKLPRLELQAKWSYLFPCFKLDQPLRVCRKMHDEILPILHQNTKTVDLAGDTSLVFLRIPPRVPQTICASIKQLETFGSSVARTLLNSLPSLQTIRITLRYSHEDKGVLQATELAHTKAQSEMARLNTSAEPKEDVEVLVGCKILLTTWGSPPSCRHLVSNLRLLTWLAECC